MQTFLAELSQQPVRAELLVCAGLEANTLLYFRDHSTGNSGADVTCFHQVPFSLRLDSQLTDERLWCHKFIWAAGNLHLWHTHSLRQSGPKKKNNATSGTTSLFVWNLRTMLNCSHNILGSSDHVDLSHKCYYSFALLSSAQMSRRRARGLSLFICCIPSHIYHSNKVHPLLRLVWWYLAGLGQP